MNTQCNVGQVYPANCSRAKCHSCQRSMCVSHDIPWHKGETCREYDQRTKLQHRGNKASRKKVKETTRPCPKCKRHIHKYSGCDHITCICGHEWCYICSAPYSRDDQGSLNCLHHQTCLHHSRPPFVDARVPPRPFVGMFTAHGFGRMAPPPLAGADGRSVRV
ncbi:uncharacterized protein B0I36DRAFT_330545 [Microdochium trichocladiopsis]|uniref:RBR-type E3 ubiquitin transferase n=1 Tax=Microdochium trichocladiopsis TaxID=1682393 RepID=A0A9P9BMY4_9PEZI|nr:uncharacterized protein B0I36DRAFT_330545 [Microdochium trichocladiopsis]KAH7026381.1 hypothetical protein B0I36DRAFT_330545 [Microdochium trichocladiopsis]